MSPLEIGLLLGVGVFFVYWSFWPQEQTREKTDSGGFMVELRDHLTQAGYTSLSPGYFVVGSVVLFAVAFVLVLAVVRVVPIAVCFAVMAGALPLSLVRARARKRRSSKARSVPWAPSQHLSPDAWRTPATPTALRCWRCCLPH